MTSIPRRTKSDSMKGSLRIERLERRELLSTNNFSALTGDYDLSGVVDDLDYAVWRDSFGSTQSLAADGNLDGVVNVADYTIWRDNFGRTANQHFGDYDHSGTVDDLDYAVWRDSFGSTQSLAADGNLDGVVTSSPPIASIITTRVRIREKRISLCLAFGLKSMIHLTRIMKSFVLSGLVECSSITNAKKPSTSPTSKATNSSSAIS